MSPSSFLPPSSSHPLPLSSWQSHRSVGLRQMTQIQTNAVAQRRCCPKPHEQGSARRLRLRKWKLPLWPPLCKHRAGFQRHWPFLLGDNDGSLATRDSSHRGIFEFSDSHIWTNVIFYNQPKRMKSHSSLCLME